MKAFPILQIDSFLASQKSALNYINRLQHHLESQRALISNPHKHDFYLTVYFTQGFGSHTIDFNTYSVETGAVFFLKPGQTHQWDLSPETDGYIIFHADFELFRSEKTDTLLPFFGIGSSNPKLDLSDAQQVYFSDLFEKLIQENEVDLAFKQEKINLLIGTILLDFTRIYPIAPQKTVKNPYLVQFERILEENFRELKSPQKYADLLCISSKHLNRICRQNYGKTASQHIADRLILEAKRMISHSDHTLQEISASLGFEEYAYFSRFFKKNTGYNAQEFKRNQEKKLRLN